MAELPACTIEAAEAGKHMVTGEPMAMTVARADEMVQSIEKVAVRRLAFQGICRGLVPVWSARLVR